MMVMILHLLGSVLKIWVFLCLFYDPLLALQEFRKKPSDYELVISDIGCLA